MKKDKIILCVDDERDILEILSYNLGNEGYKVYTADNGKDALTIADRVMPEVILLDIMMPGFDGYEVCKALRQNAKLKNASVVFLTAKSEEVDEVLGLELGADDYLTKPFSPRVITAKVRAIFRQKERLNKFRGADKEIIKIGEVEIDRLSYTVKVAEVEIKLLPKEFDLLYFLMKRPGIVFSRKDLLYNVWGEDAYQIERTVDVHVTKIRKKLNNYARHIQTVQGVGYKFVQLID